MVRWRGPLSVLKDTWSDDQYLLPHGSISYQNYFHTLRQDIERGIKIASMNADKTQSTYVNQYNLRSKDKTF